MDQLEKETDSKEVAINDDLECEKKHHSTLTIALLVFIAALLLSFFVAFLLSSFTRPKGKPIVSSTTSYTYDDKPNVCSSCGQAHSCGADCTNGNGCTSCNAEENENGTDTNENAKTENAK